jgi:hypothetical protein
MPDLLQFAPQRQISALVIRFNAAAIEQPLRRPVFAVERFFV